MPMSNVGFSGGGSVFKAMIRPSPALYDFMPDNAYGAMQAGTNNPMYGNIGIQPGFQCAARSYGMPQANMGMVGFAQPYAQNMDMTGTGVANCYSKAGIGEGDNLTTQEVLPTWGFCWGKFWSCYAAKILPEQEMLNNVLQGLSDARVLPKETNCPSGQAIAIFESRMLAESALESIEINCLVMADRKWPVIASRVKESVNEVKFPGHLGLEKLKLGRTFVSEDYVSLLFLKDLTTF
ncbi:hypothetical protein L7F22_061554 [Adiantum nelumboides]|nr:hypothetical protein [Adiantum nelumboides]